MNKKEITRELSKRLNHKYTIENLEMILNSMIEVFKDALKTNEKIDIKGFIKIEQKLHKATEGSIGDNKWSKPERYIAKVTLSPSFKKEVCYEK